MYTVVWSLESNNGVIIVDSTREGKSFPGFFCVCFLSKFVLATTEHNKTTKQTEKIKKDSFMRTIPIWCYVINCVLNDKFEEMIESNNNNSNIFHKMIPQTEIIQIKEKSKEWIYKLKHSKLPVIEQILNKNLNIKNMYLKPFWIDRFTNLKHKINDIQSIIHLGVCVFCLLF